MTDVVETTTDRPAAVSSPARPLGVSLLAALSAITGLIAPFAIGFDAGPDELLLGVIVGGIGLAMAYGLWTLKPWAWPLAFVAIVLTTLAAVALLTQGTLNSNLIVGPIALLYLAQPGIRRLFARGWSGPRVAAVALGALAGIALLLNIAGLAPIPVGPLGDHQPAVADGSRSTLDFEPGRTAIYLSALVENTGPIAATVVRVTPIGVTVPGSVAVLGSLPFNSSDEYGPDSTERVLLGVQSDPGPGWSNPQPVAGVPVDPKGSAQYQGRAFLVRMTLDPTKETAVLRFDVEYTIGPLHFVTTAWGPVGTTVLACPADQPIAQETGCGAG